ncbi:hypothetical protein L6452_19508 [Arctium lappa]|uniref:Uncharacterized protein n=1 Tax=Arctium lappa TaxID=4217 RepID=A0ACB9B9N1_ARCLA|nr:hypothetical protein L6452_19508 [Arctium lappa]
MEEKEIKRTRVSGDGDDDDDDDDEDDDDEGDDDDDDDGGVGAGFHPDVGGDGVGFHHDAGGDGSGVVHDAGHIEVWVRLHLESRSTLADWSIMLPDFMYYMTELKDLSYLTQQCNGAQGSAGFPAWGTINKVRHCRSGAPPPLQT